MQISGAQHSPVPTKWCTNPDGQTTSGGYRVYSTGEFAGLKLAIFNHFGDVLVTYKDTPPLYIGLFSPQIWPDLRGVKNWCEKGGNPPIGGKKHTLLQYALRCNITGASQPLFYVFC